MRLKGLLKKEIDTNTRAIGMMQEEFNGLLNNERFIHYVGMTKPFTPGVRECMFTVQYTHFNPQSQQSALFFMHTIRWAGRIWITMSIPVEYMDAVEKIVAGCGLESIKGVPMLVVEERLETFLSDTGRIFVLDNPPDHPIYRDDPLVEETLKEFERKAIDKIIRS